jgi:hypothetical protein
MNLRLVVAVVIVVALAGCGGAAPKTDDVVVVESGKTVEAESGKKADEPTEKGDLVGHVLDDALRPVQGARVRLPGLEMARTTKDDGSFQFKELAPGPYFIEATATAFAPLSDVVDIQANKENVVRIILNRLPVQDPRHETQPFSGFAEFALDPLTSNWVPMCSKCTFQVRLSDYADTLVVEAKRDVSTASPAPHFRLEVTDGSGRKITDTEHEDKFVHHLDRSLFGSSTVFYVEVTPYALPAESNVKFQVFVTSFHHGAAPEDWSFMAGDR